MKNFLRYFLCGLAVGGTDVVPGVSGGTIAFILGIYGKIFEAVKSVNIQFFKLLAKCRVKDAFGQVPWDFVIPLLLGVVTAIFSLARIIIYVLETYPVVIWSFFFGLILASIVILVRQMDLKKPGTWLAFALGVAFAWWISGLGGLTMEPSLPVYFFSGFIAICAMILPGISGSFILLLLGQYHHVIQAVATLDLPVILVFGSGCVLGLMTFARILDAVYKRWPSIFLALLTGIMAGALRAVWPWKEAGYPALPAGLDSSVLVALACCLLGAGFFLLINVLPRMLSPRKPG